MADYSLYRLSVTTITPLHIGSGVKLLNEYDYTIRSGMTWRIDHSALLDEKYQDDPRFLQTLQVTAPGQLLSDADFQPGSSFFRYVIKGSPRSKGEGAQLNEQLKNAFDEVYLPGSSLKGALRTALGWRLWADLSLRPEIRLVGRSAKFAAKDYESQIFGRTPNTDLLRALQISDSQPVSPERLMALNVRVLGRGGALASPIELEAIRPETTFELDAKVDLALFSAWARRSELTAAGQNALSLLPNAVNARALARARREEAWFKEIKIASRLLTFYQQLARSRLEPNQFILQLGFGSGWEDKTFGDRLSADGRFMESIIQSFRMSRARGRKQGDPFPSSRRVAVAITRNPSGTVVETPAYPLGWVLVNFDLVRGLKTGWKPSTSQESPPSGPAAPAQPSQGGQKPTPTPTAAPPTTNPAVPPAQQAVRKPSPPAPPAQQPTLVTSFTSQPQPGQQFRGEVIDIDKTSQQAFIELPGLSADEWMGVVSGGVRSLRMGNIYTFIITGIVPDPESKGSWIVNCQYQV